jgi:xanthine dehydrogenase molybdopterin-binding subunit B
VGRGTFLRIALVASIVRAAADFPDRSLRRGGGGFGGWRLATGVVAIASAAVVAAWRTVSPSEEVV